VASEPNTTHLSDKAAPWNATSPSRNELVDHMPSWSTTLPFNAWSVWRALDAFISHPAVLSTTPGMGYQRAHSPADASDYRSATYGIAVYPE